MFKRVIAKYKKYVMVVAVSLSATTATIAQYTKHIVISSSEHGTWSGQPTANKPVGFIRHNPSPLVANVRYPAVIFLHGIGEEGPPGDTTTANGVDRLVATYPVAGLVSGGVLANREYVPWNSQNPTQDRTKIVWVAPQCDEIYNSWPVMYVLEMIKYLKTLPYVDPNRIYLTGLSYGGGGTLTLVTNVLVLRSIAAAGANCAGYWSNTNNYQVLANSGLPLWIAHSKADRTTQVSGTNGAVISDSIVANIMRWKPRIPPVYYKFEDTPEADDHRIWNYMYIPSRWTVPLLLVQGSTVDYTDPNWFEWALQYSLPLPGTGWRP